MSKWILCKDEMPPINTDVLVFTGEYQFPYEVMKYCSDYWSDNNGGIRASNPVAWQFIDNFMKEGEIWVEGRVV